MSSLSRRVSSMKAQESRIRISNLFPEPLKLPQEYQELEDETDYVKEFLSAETVPDQLCFVKQRLLSANEISAEELKFFVDIMLQSPLKHPVRNQIMKFLQQPKISELVLDVLPCSIAMIIEKLKTSSIAECNDILTSLGTCFENFPSGVKALERNIQELFSDLIIVIAKLIMETSCHHSPSMKNEFCFFLHNAIRLSLSCVQEFSKTQSLDILHDALKSLKDNSLKIINMKDIPMDIKTNCAMLLSHIPRILGNFEEYVEHCMKETERESKCVQLCLCMGLVNTIEMQFFIENSHTVSKIVTQIIEIATAHSNENSMLLAGLRSLVQFSRFLILNLKDDVYVDQEMIKLILRKLIDFDLSFIGCNMDNVRHLCKDMLRNIFKFKNKLMLDDLIQDIFDYCNSKDIPTAFRSVVITCAGNALGTEYVISKLPNLFNDIFAELGKDPHICTCYEALMLCHLREKKSNDKDIWRRTWIDPLLNIASSFPDKIEVVENLLNKAVLHEPGIAETVMSNVRYEIPLCVKFSIMWTVRKNGLKYDQFGRVFQTMESDLMRATTLNLDEVKIMALRLIVETNKTTTYVNEMECDFILKFLRYNSNCQSPATREKSQALILKFLSRLDLNFTRCKKEKNESLLGTYSTFLHNFLNLLASNFFIGANFSRKSISLNLLEKAVDLAISNDLCEMIPKQIRKCLFELLNDSYESNAALAMKILKSLPQKGIIGCDVRVSLNVIEDLITSVRPTDCVAAAYYLEYFCLEISVEEAQSKLQVKNLPQKHQLYYCVIVWLLRILQDSIETAEKSITLAAKFSPLYGSLFAIRHFLEKIYFVSLSNCSRWREIVGTLIDSCKRMTKVVGPIVNSSSPEGHLPNDFSDLSNYLDDYTSEDVAKFGKLPALKKKLLHSENIDLNVTPQMILLCAWRTIKEVSLTLGEIVSRSPIQRYAHDEEYFLTAQQIFDIGDHFKQLLSETKHRGAFEQAYVGFSNLCSRLWRLPHAALSELPSKWLVELIDLITTDEQINKKICATRRSAGVPFMVQAICIAELQVGATVSLHSCMSKFINLCADPKKSEESRTHALNIMRSLFRCTELNAVVGEYIANAVKCAINGYAANSWSEKNSATLLLSSLIVRIFGVQRSKGTDNLSKENKMSGRIFFLRYPSLYDFMVTELKSIANSVALNTERSAKLQPILMILSRLYPSALDGTETTYKLSTFVPLVSASSGCNEWQHRVLIAKIIVAYTPINEMNSIALNCLVEAKEAVESKTLAVKTSYLQSLILQALYLLRAKEIDYGVAENIVSRTFDILMVLPLSPLVCAPIIEILLTAMEKCNDIRKYCDIARVQLFLIPKFENTSHTILKRSIFIYHLQLMTGSNDVVNTAIYMQQILNPSYNIAENQDVVESCLNVLLLLFRDPLPLKEIVDQFECSTYEVAVVESFHSDMRNRIVAELTRTNEFKNTLMSLTQVDYLNPHCIVKTYSLLSKLNSILIGDHMFISALLDKVDDDSTGELKNAIAQCIGKVLHDGAANKASFGQILDFLLDISQPWNSPALRKSAAYVLHEVTRILFSSLESFVTLQITLVFAKLVLLMVQDDDSEVREKISITITDLFSTSSKQDIFVESYAQIVFLEKFADYMAEHFDVDEKIQIITDMVRFLQIESKSNQKTGDDDEAKIFDKQEVNVFGEPYKIILDLINVFSEKFSNYPQITCFFKSKLLLDS